MGVRSRPDVVATWDDTQVALRWWQLCPTRKVKLEINSEWVKTPATPTEFELNAIRNDPVRLATIRLRLSDLSWWMRLDFAFLSTWRTPQNAASRMEITQSIFAMFFLLFSAFLEPRWSVLWLGWIEIGIPSWHLSTDKRAPSMQSDSKPIRNFRLDACQVVLLTDVIG